MRIYVACKETGDKIEEVKSIKEGLKIIKEYERQDKKDKIFEENFYNLINENYENLT